MLLKLLMLETADLWSYMYLQFPLSIADFSFKM